MAALKYWLWLAGLRGLDSQVKLSLLEHFGTPENIYLADREEQALAGCDTVEHLEALADRSLERADRILGDCGRLNLRIVTIHDAEYPDRLRNIYDPPLLLYVQGRLPVFDDEVAIAMVGTRNCSAYGARTAEKLAYELARQGALVVSGLAKGLDAMCHRGALRAGGLTAAVIGGGHDIKYPRENESLYDDIAATGAILSEYPPGTRPLAGHFPVRNRIISGLCLGTVVIEAPLRSGALITARTALEQGRDVFAVPGPIDAAGSRGTNQLLQEGAVPAISGYAILQEYEGRYPHKLQLRPVKVPAPQGYQARRTPPPEPEKAGPAEELPLLDLRQGHGLTEDQLHILRALEGAAMQVDDVIEATQLPARRVLSALTMLEVEGRVRQESGKRFTLAVRLQE